MLFRRTDDTFRVAARLLALGTGLAMVLAIGLYAQEAAGQAQKGAKKGRPGEGNTQPQDEYGFNQIFDGKTLTGWDGDPTYWRVEDGAIVGQNNPQIKANTFLIWRGGTPGNFELRLSFRLDGWNSGIQYRSSELPQSKWGMKGYQADMTGVPFNQGVTGNIREEASGSDARRAFAALRGQFTYIAEGKKPQLVGSLGQESELRAILKDPPEWNDLQIIARGYTLIQVINGRVMSIMVDDDLPFRKADGLIGIQVHTGQPMKIEVRNIRIKML